MSRRGAEVFVSRKRGKHKRAKQAVPEEILAEGSGPHQDANALAEAASEALAGTHAPEREEVVYEAASQPADEPAAEVDVVATDEVVFDATHGADTAEPEVQAEAASDQPKRRRKKRRTAMSDLEVAAVEAQVDADAAAADEAVVAADALEADATDDVHDSEVGPELEEAEVAAEQAAQLDEQQLDAELMRAEAEAELGAAEAEAEPGEEDLELSAALPTTAATMDDLQLKHLVEALIFAADKPVTLQRLRQLTRVSDIKRLEQAIAVLATDYADRGIALQQVSGGYQFRTNTQFSTWVQQLIAGRPVRLSRAQLETLAIIAYRQPITRPEVDEIRGVDSSATLRLLMDRSLIRILGKKEDVGRPILYGTTKEFLDFFSLSDLRELPTLREYSELTAESRKVMSDRLGIGVDASGADVSGEVEDEGESEPVEAADASIVEGTDTSVDDLVREFAESDVDATTGEGDASADLDASADASAQVDADDTSAELVASADLDASDDSSAQAGMDELAGDVSSDLDASGDSSAHVGTDEMVGDAGAGADLDASADARAHVGTNELVGNGVSSDLDASDGSSAHVGTDDGVSEDANAALEASVDSSVHVGTDDMVGEDASAALEASDDSSAHVGTDELIGDEVSSELDASSDSSAHVCTDEMASEDADAVLAASSVTDEANHSGAESAAESDDPDARTVASTGNDVTAAEALDSTDEPSRD
jgi:segregation and condensation protein B